ncbi:MAG: Succinate-semialdehyde dehydrogenase [NADP(+)] 1 [Chroococcopsis gigantea SAG 12.99]|jgi:succinate-semialdehyde dehydrogenase/glutarate-semialdehyde dehydrogenase|nr:NAD-dependent succinate-semialdehyde dehydrogenase [Chlorogloea purpurea SAG 13.99]MDV3000733.1 Succinate-semialdehyde dehydrogenase [NADP(+)] 1 [Chroococcopsis gigantea SAG 12.99]
MAIATVNPTTGETIKTFTPLTPEEIEAKITGAGRAFEEYKQIPFSQRSQWLGKAADILEAREKELATTMTIEMGKTLRSAGAEVQKCALVCRYYAENGVAFMEDAPSITDAAASFVRYQPLGIILAVMPWNFPLWQVFRFAAPALMAGNVGLLKHASNVPQCALAIEDILSKAGFPAGVFQTLLIGAPAVAPLMEDSRIKAATLTGSESAGISLAVAAAKQIKKTVLELGGSDPFIVLDSADIGKAVSTAVTARMLNNGQSCIGAKRFILHEAIADKFEASMIEKFKALKVGDPFDEATDIGPLATPSILQDIAAQVDKTVAMGGKIKFGGYKLDGPGNFYAPTILTDIPTGSPGQYEEFFGPVALLFRVPDISTAIALANDSPFGLGASAWTTKPEEIDRLVNEIEAGAVFINAMTKSDPRLPFGGTKRSGYGRELSKEGLYEFVNTKTVWIDSYH